MGRRLASVLGLFGALVAGTGVVGVAGTTSAVHDMSQLSERIQPGIAANNRVLARQGDADAAVRAWVVSADPSARRDYAVAVARQEAELSRLESLVAEVPALRAGVERQSDGVRRWRGQYAEVALAGEGGERRTERREINRGLARSAELRESNRMVATGLEERAAAARREMADRSRTITLGTGLAVLLALLIAALLARRLMRDVRDPLVGLDRTLERHAQGEWDARAREDGPLELRRVAREVNRLTVENLGARESEQAVRAGVGALDATRAELLSNVSHELRTPITSIGGYVDLLGHELGPDHEHQHMVAAIERNLTRLTRLVDDLLTVSSPRPTEAPVAPVELVGLVADVIVDQRTAAARRHVTIRLAVPHKPVRLPGDPAQLHRAVGNLVSNAVKFSDPGQAVEVTLLATDADVAVRVADSGIGIPEADQALVGTRFFRASNAVEARVPGTGLGLRIAQAIADNHGGEVRLESTEGVGTVATLVLPVGAERELAPAPLR